MFEVMKKSFLQLKFEIDLTSVADVVDIIVDFNEFRIFFDE